MKFKKLVALTTATVLSASMLVGCSSSADTNEDTFKIAMVTDVAGVNDQSFNQSAWEGLQKAEKELGVEVSYRESNQESDYMTNIESLVDEDTDLIVGVGMKLASAVEESAKLYPEQKFVIVEEDLGVEFKNVQSVLFNAQEPTEDSEADAESGSKPETKYTGIIVGVVAVVLCAAAGFVLIWLKKKRLQQ